MCTTFRHLDLSLQFEMALLTTVALFLCGLSSLRVSAQVPFFGKCPDVSAMTGFDPKRFLGKWHEAERYFAIFEGAGKCVTAEYTENDNGGITVINKQLSILNGVQNGIKGEARQVGMPDEGKLEVRFPSMPANFPAPFWIVDTDYDSYAVVWGCNDLFLSHTRNAWILTRERNPPSSVIERALEAADKSNVNPNYFLKTDQEDCPDEF
ncbi:hypothetical protein O0L34_g14733 [Tuta absoluta]|nr:hypothetical protein O0L34_g14733 [Tuta absoluta]